MLSLVNMLPFVNHFQTQEEIAQSFASLRVPADLKREPSAFVGSSGAPIPDTFDWREKGYVTGVKMQVMMNSDQGSLCLLLYILTCMCN